MPKKGQKKAKKVLDEDNQESAAENKTMKKMKKKKSKKGTVVKEAELHVKTKKKSSKKAKTVASTELDAVVADASLDIRSASEAPVSTTALSANAHASHDASVVLEDAPAVLGVLGDMESKAREMSKFLQPLLQTVKDRELPTQQGISFLSAKMHLLLSYVIHVTFLLLLRAEGRSIKGHPVVQQLARLRVMLEKLKPVDKKLKYQIDKLLKMADKPVEDGKDAEAEANALKFKPNPSNLASNDNGDTGDVYRISRLASSALDEDKSVGKRAKEDARLRARASQSKLVKQLRSELYSDRPERVEVFGDTLIKGDKEDQERQSYEEDNFLRLMETKKDKKKRKAKVRFSAFQDFNDFGDLSMLAGRGSESGAGGPDSRSMDMDDQGFQAGLDMFDGPGRKRGAGSAGAGGRGGGAKKRKRR